MNYKEVKGKLIQITNKFPYKTGASPFSGANFMTNYIAKRGRFSNEVWFEISFGTGIYPFSDWFYGVTLKGTYLKLKTIEGCCHTFEEVEAKMKEAYNI